MMTSLKDVSAYGGVAVGLGVAALAYYLVSDRFANRQRPASQAEVPRTEVRVVEAKEEQDEKAGHPESSDDADLVRVPSLTDFYIDEYEPPEPESDSAEDAEWIWIDLKSKPAQSK